MSVNPWLPENENVHQSWRGLLKTDPGYIGDPCPHENVHAFQRVIANGALVVVVACTKCFQAYSVKKSDHPRHAEYPLYPTDARTAYHEAKWKKHQAEVDAERAKARAAQSAEWWERYDDYLRSAAWQKRRDLVLKRAGFVCEACLEARATEVHHTTYKHLFNEPLFELRAVCHGCHELITRLDRGEVVG